MFHSYNCLTPHGLTQTTAVGVKTKFYANILMIIQKFAPLTARKKKIGNTNMGFEAMLLPNGIFWHYIQVVS